MKQHDTGGTAFPVPDDASDMPGMTMRDYFAAKAMQGFLACDLECEPELFPTTVAKAAYQMADAMLKARQP